jgi:hypothetical protein
LAINGIQPVEPPHANRVVPLYSLFAYVRSPVSSAHTGCACVTEDRVTIVLPSSCHVASCVSSSFLFCFLGLIFCSVSFTFGFLDSCARVSARRDRCSFFLLPFFVHCPGPMIYCLFLIIRVLLFRGRGRPAPAPPPLRLLSVINTADLAAPSGLQRGSPP